MKKASLIISMVMTAMTIGIVGCGGSKGDSKSDTSDTSVTSESKSEEDISSETSEEASSSISDYDYSDEHLKQVDPYSYETTYRGMRIDGSGYSAEQYTTYRNDEGKKKYAITDVKALVIPVDFTDYLGADLPLGEEGTREQLQRVMFGDDMPWYSLASYYKSSSYGQCNITGAVGDWWHVGQSSKDFNNEYKTTGSQKIAIAIQDYYRKQYSNAKMMEDEEMMAKYDLTQYDANKDGFIDSLILIYSAPITTTGELFWAFCWSVPGAYGRYNPTLEGVNRFFWASYWFFYDEYLDHKTKPYGIPDTLVEGIKDGQIDMDAHTMTHEYGHVLGLPDYYITDYNTSDFDGMGYLDMMDYNIGDHNAASKAWYGWIDPYYVTGSVKTRIRSTTTTGDTIIIPIQGNYRNTLMDQYIMIEFLTPEGVAKMDGEVPFGGTYPLYYNQAGIRVIHVDARLGVFNYNTTLEDYTFGGFTVSTNRPEGQSYVGTACSNTASDSCFKDYKLLEVLPRDGKSIKYKGAASNDTLFKEGDSFGKEGGAWANYMMHNTAGGKDVPLGFEFEITKIQGNEYADITITKIR